MLPNHHQQTAVHFIMSFIYPVYCAVVIHRPNDAAIENYIAFYKV